MSAIKENAVFTEVADIGDLEALLVRHGLGHFAERVGERPSFLSYGVEIVEAPRPDVSFGVRYAGPPDDKQVSHITRLLAEAVDGVAGVEVLEAAPRLPAAWTAQGASSLPSPPDPSETAVMRSLLTEFHETCFALVADGEHVCYTTDPLARRVEHVLKALDPGVSLCPTARRLALCQVRPLLIELDRRCINLIDPSNSWLSPYDDRREGALMVRTTQALHGETAAAVLLSSENDDHDADQDDQRDLMRAVHDVLGDAAEDMLSAGASEDVLVAAAIRAACARGLADDMIALLRRAAEMEDAPLQMPLPGFGEAS